MKNLILSILAVFILAFSASATVITVGAYDVTTTWTFGGSTATIRIYSTRTFITSTGSTVTQGYATGFYKTINCTVASTTVSCPSFTIDSTIDSSIPSSKYIAEFYDSTGRSRGRYMEQFTVPTSLGTSVTWAQLRIYNTAPLPMTNFNYYSTTAIDSFLAGKQDTLVNQSNIKSVNGTSLLGSGNVTITGTAAWGGITGTLTSQSDLNSALIAKQDGLISGTNIKTVNGNSILGSGNLLIAGGGGSGGNGVNLSTYGGDLVAALNVISSTPTTLYVDTNSTPVTTNVVIPSTVRLIQVNGSTITMTGTGSLNCQGRCVDGDENKFFTTSVPQTLWVNQGQVNLTTDTIGFTAHAQSTGEQVRYTLMRYLEAAGTLPLVIGGLTDNQIYYIIRIDANNFKLATTYANALAGTAINLTAGGQAGFRLDPSPVIFSGSLTPPTVSTEIFDTGNNSETDRANLVTRALTGHGAWIEVYPRTVTSAVLGADKHNFRFKAGDHLNSFNGTTYGWPYYPWTEPWNVGSDAEFTSDGGAIIYESTVDYVQALVATRPGARHSRIHHNYFKQSNPAQANGSAAVVAIPGGYDNHITDNYFDTIRGYALAINPIEGRIDNPDSCTAERNIIKNTLTQVLFLGGGTHIAFTDNIVDARGFTQGVAFSWFDVEPNAFVKLEDILIARNVFDARDTDFLGGSLLGFIRINPAGGCLTVKRMKILDNEFLANEDNFNPSVGKYGGIDAVGLNDFEISGNKGYGISAAWSFISVQKAVSGRVFNNTSYSGAGQIWVQASQRVEVFGNRHIYSNGIVEVTENDGVTEGRFGDGGGSAQSWAFNATPAADKIQFFNGYWFGYESGELFTHFAGATAYINNNPYVIKTITNGDAGFADYAVIQFTTNLASLPALEMLIPAANINIATDTLHYVNHGYVTGAAIAYYNLSGPDAMGGVRYGYQWVIRVDADNFKLANTAEDAAAGIAANITSVPVGSTQPFYPGMAIYSSANSYHDNTGVTLLGINSTSYAGTASVTIDPASIAANTVSTQTFTLPGARVGDNVSLNPPAAGLTAGLLVLQTTISADNTVKVVFDNTTGAPIDEASGTWRYSLKRGG
jgi:hypothetical protein